MALDPKTIGWVRSVLASEAVVGGPLPGGVTSEVYLLAGGRFVVKQVTNARWLRERPDVVAYEARLLEYLADSVIPVPRLMAVDPDGAEAGYPTLVMTAARGAPAGEVAPPPVWMDELAGLSAAILGLEAPNWVRPFARYQAADAAVPPDWSGDAALWERAIGAVTQPPPPAPERFLHRDFHPWNAVWEDGITAIVDWSQTSVGPAPMDLAHCCANLAIRFDPETADAYRETWERVSGFEHHPYWDLVTCVDFLPDWRPSAGGNDKLDAWLRHVLTSGTG